MSFFSVLERQLSLILQVLKSSDEMMEIEEIDNLISDESTSKKTSVQLVSVCGIIATLI